MAFTAGDIVTMQITDPGVFDNNPLNLQPPQFGIVQANEAGAAVDVLWQSGLLQSAIAAPTLDRVENPAAATLALIGTIVFVDGESSEYDAIVVNAYKRNPNTAGAGPDRCLLRMRTTGTFRELPAASLTSRPGR